MTKNGNLGNEDLKEETSAGEQCDSSQNEDGACNCNGNDGGDASSAQDISVLKSELDKKNAEISSLKDVMIRRQADFDNYRKRVLKNEDQNKKMAVVDVVKEVLKINDDILRAAESTANMKDTSSVDDVKKSFADGVILISKNIDAILKKYNITEIDSEGAAFNPNIHEAVEIDCSETVSIDTVAHVYQKGYMLDEFVIRNARVKVFKPKTPVSDKNEENVSTD
jgi:molecular chaperone GrpE